jgi:uncharacterized membrane protein YeiH
MTITLFLTLVTILSIISSAITEAIKKVFGDQQPTLVDLVLSVVTGIGGGFAAYILMGINFTPTTIICLILLPLAIWLCSTLGYDKVKEIIEQIGMKS